jgi:exonuclease I
MSIQTENLGQISVEDLLRPFESYEKVEATLQKKEDEQWHEQNLQKLFGENMQLHDQVAMLEAEVDKQDKIIKLLAEALFLTYGDK